MHISCQIHFMGQNSAIYEPISLNMTEQKLTKEMITYRFDVV